MLLLETKSSFSLLVLPSSSPHGHGVSLFSTLAPGLREKESINLDNLLSLGRFWPYLLVEINVPFQSGELVLVEKQANAKVKRGEAFLHARC